MHVYVKEHQYEISQNLVHDTKLKITVELLESAFDERMKREVEKLHDRMKPKIKKRVKMKQIESKLLTKCNLHVFNKEMNRLDDKLQLIGDTVDHKLPAMEYKFEREMKNKGSVEDVKELRETKADQEFVDSLVLRLNKIEEQAAAQEINDVVEESEPEVQEVVEGADPEKPESPRSPKKKRRSRQGDSDDEEAEERRKKFEETLKQLKDMQEKLQTQLSSSIDDVRKQIDDQAFNVKRIEQEVEEVKKAQKKSAEMLDLGDQDDGAAITNKQEIFNRKFIQRLEKMDDQVAKLLRVDFRLNKELVQKPYAYIDKLKENIMKEQKDIAKVIKDNNDKYITKMSHMDHKVTKVLTDTETLLDQYRKKIGQIGKDLESTRRYRETISSMTSGFQKQLDRIAENCDSNHNHFTNHLDKISLKFAENTVDLTACSEGFQREIERVQVLFRELQQEFLLGLEEKRVHNETLLRGAGVGEKDLKRAYDNAKQSSQKGL